MLSNKAVLSAKINEKIHEFHVAADATLGEVHDALVKMRQYVVQRMQEELAKEQPQEKKE